MKKRTERGEQAAPVTSSIARTLPAKQESLFREVLTLLNKLRLAYAASGAFALREHTGICRYTKDLDIFLSASDASDALEHLGEHGFDCEVRDPVWLAKAHRFGYSLT